MVEMPGMFEMSKWCIGLLLVPLAALGCAGNSAAAPPVAVYASSGKLLRAYALDTKTGALALTQTLPALDNDVHYVAVHPSRKNLYVSCSEIPPPENRPYVNVIRAFSIDGHTGALTALGNAYTPPLSRAVHITVDRTGHYLLLAHNFTESVSVLRLKADGSLGEPVTQPEERQSLGFLVHQVRVDPSNQWVFVPVRGNDEKLGHLATFDFREGELRKRSILDYPQGLGPRHLDFHPSQPWIYVAMERGNRLLTYKHENGTLTELFNTTTLADPSITSAAQGVGAIHVHPNGQWVYVANRNTSGREGENDVAVFSVNAATGEPKLIQNLPTHGISPRTMSIDPTGHILIVANQFKGPNGETPNLSTFAIAADGKLTYLRTYTPTGGDAWWVGAVALP